MEGSEDLRPSLSRWLSELTEGKGFETLRMAGAFFYYEAGVFFIVLGKCGLKPCRENRGLEG
jgi:hypothetical protein